MSSASSVSDWRGLLAIDVAFVLVGLALTPAWRRSVEDPRPLNLFPFLAVSALLVLSLRALRRSAAGLRAGASAPPPPSPTGPRLGSAPITSWPLLFKDVWKACALMGALGYPMVNVGFAFKAATDGASLERGWPGNVLFAIVILSGVYGVWLAMLGSSGLPAAPPGDVKAVEAASGARRAVLLNALAVNAFALVSAPVVAAEFDGPRGALVVPFLFVPRLALLVLRFEPRAAATTTLVMLAIMGETAASGLW